MGSGYRHAGSCMHGTLDSQRQAQARQGLKDLPVCPNWLAVYMSSRYTQDVLRQQFAGIGTPVPQTGNLLSYTRSLCANANDSVPSSVSRCWYRSRAGDRKFANCAAVRLNRMLCYVMLS